MLILVLGICLYWTMPYLFILVKDTINPPKLISVDLATIHELAEKYKPAVVFDEQTLFYPTRFDGLKKIALEVDKVVVAELEINDSLRALSNQLDSPTALFKIESNAAQNSLIYTYSLSTIPEKWREERALKTFPDTLHLYVNYALSDYLKIVYTIPFEGNHWTNFHRGDGAMFAIYFAEKDGILYPAKTRAYMHLQYQELAYQSNLISTNQNKTRPIFYVTSGSHSTYHRPGKYLDVDGLPILNASEEAKRGYTYCQDKTQLIFAETTRSNLEKWGFEGQIYWGGSPNDRIFEVNDWKQNIPILRDFPLGNRSARMSSDPSSVFDKKAYESDNALKPMSRVICN